MLARPVLMRGVRTPRPALAREVVVGLDYYGIILPSEVEAFMTRLLVEVATFENDLASHFAGKYGETPAAKWESEDLQFFNNFRLWASQYREFANNYINGACRPDMPPVVKQACYAKHSAWQWVASNSLAAYKQTEAYEGQLSEWRKMAKERNVSVASPSPVSAVTKLPDGVGSDIASIVKWVAIGAVGYMGLKVVLDLRRKS